MSQKRVDLRRGSLTVEASVVVPLTFFVMICLITLLFYVHNRMWFGCAAYEAAIRANAPGNPGDQEPGAAAEQFARHRTEDQIMPGARPEVRVQAASGKTSVQSDGGRETAWFGTIAAYQVQAAVRKVRPEKTVRLIWTGKQAAG